MRASFAGDDLDVTGEHVHAVGFDGRAEPVQRRNRR